MMEYVDLVLCKHQGQSKKFLFEAPKLSYLKSGEEVIVETRHGEAAATVIKSITLRPDSDTYQFIIEASGATLPLKRVIKICKYKTLEYKEDNEDAD